MLKLMLEKLAKLVAIHLEKKFVSFSIATLTVQPGDVIIVKSRWALSDEAWSRLANSIRCHFPSNEVVALEDDLDLAIIRANKQ
jgi:hypothetical protein